MTMVIEHYKAVEENYTATISVDKDCTAYKLYIGRFFYPETDRVYLVRITYYKTVKAAKQALKRYGKCNGLTWTKEE